eukprot:270221-Ditylum_brightwellii.AAC.1
MQQKHKALKQSPTPQFIVIHGPQAKHHPPHPPHHHCGDSSSSSASVGDNSSCSGNGGGSKAVVATVAVVEGVEAVSMDAFQRWLVGQPHIHYDHQQTL